MKFSHEENEAPEQERADQCIRAVFTIIQRPSLLLKGGEAIITFEEEKGKLWKNFFFSEGKHIDDRHCQIIFILKLLQV